MSETPGEPTWTIFEAPQRLRDEYRRLHGRMTDAIAFELPITNEAIDALLEAEGAEYEPGMQLPEWAVSPEVRRAVEECVPDGGYGYYEADSGRGASGYAVALELMGYVADAGGVLALSAAAYKGTRHLYDRLRSTLGRRPLVSLGAALHLAAADLVDRLDPPQEFSVHGCGDARTPAPDASYSGDDHFFIVFSTDRGLHSYLVDAYGRVHYLGQVPIRRMWDDDGRD
jgi:hypothetical protein